MPLLTRDVILIASACGGGARAERDRALILLGFAGAFRRSKLCGIESGHLKFVREGLAVHLPSSKGDQERVGETVAIAANPLSAHCPVAAVRSWIDIAEVVTGPLFRRVTRDGVVGSRPLSTKAVRLILQMRAEDAGFQQALGHDPFSGQLFVFRGKRGDLVKCLWWDTQGMVLYAKRLERGRFIWPQAEEGSVSLTPAQLSMLLEGIDWRMPARSWQPEMAG